MPQLTPSQLADIKKLIDDIVDRQSSAEPGTIPYVEAQTLEFEKWRLIHKYIHSTPFRTREHQKRSDQWRDAAAETRHIGETEVLDWVLLQVEVANNLERGIQDMRPRKNGPCHPLLLEYVSDRKRKAHAILPFAIAGENKGAYTVNSKFHAKSVEILERSCNTYSAHDEGHEVLPWSSDEDGK